MSDKPIWRVDGKVVDGIQMNDLLNAAQKAGYDAGVKAERKRCATACHPEDFELGSSENCALQATKDEIIMGK